MIILTEPVYSDLNDIVLRLGSFHTEISFLGCIGHLMAASGLHDLLELIYASNTEVHMLTGRSIARAVRGYLIVNAALNALLLAKTFNVPLPGCTVNEDEEAEDVTETTAPVIEEIARNSDLNEAAILYKKLMQGSVTVDQDCHADVVTRIYDDLQREIKYLKPSRTATIWLLHMDMFHFLRKHIHALKFDFTLWLFIISRAFSLYHIRCAVYCKCGRNGSGS